MKRQVKQDPIAVEALNPAFKKARFGPKPRTVRWVKRRLSRQQRHEANKFMQEVWAEQDQSATLDAYYNLLWCEVAAHTLWEEAQVDYYAECDASEYYDDIDGEYADDRYGDADDWGYADPYPDYDDGDWEDRDDFDRWSDHDRVDRDLWNVKDAAHSLARLDVNCAINLVDGFVKVRGQDSDARNAARLLERLGFTVMRVGS